MAYVVPFERTGLGRELAAHPNISVEEDCLLRWLMGGHEYGIYLHLGRDFSDGLRAITKRLRSFGNFQKYAWE